jgi:hypothetical protein
MTHFNYNTAAFIDQLVAEASAGKGQRRKEQESEEQAPPLEWSKLNDREFRERLIRQYGVHV